jgi:hypothetical protein
MSSPQKVNVSIETNVPDSSPGWGVLGQSVENVYIELAPLMVFRSWEIANWLGLTKETFSRFCGAVGVRWPKRGRDFGSVVKEAWIRIGFSHILQTSHLYFFINQHFLLGQKETAIRMELGETSDKTAMVRIRLEWPKVQTFVPVGPALSQAVESAKQKRPREEETPVGETENKKLCKTSSFIILDSVASSLCDLTKGNQ